jgi:hypothetical protein
MMDLSNSFGRIAKRPLGLYCVAGYFLANGFHHLYGLSHHFFVPSELGPVGLVWLALLALGFLVAGIGLLFRRGLGWNFAMFFNFYPLFFGIRYIAQYFVLEPSASLLIRGGITLLITGLIFGYLLRTPTRNMFPESPASLSFLGTSLIIFWATHRSESELLSILGIVLIPIGGGMLAMATRQFGKTPGRA